MDKIIKIQDDVVSLGMQNGTIKEVRREDLNFEPEIGQIVDVFESETNMIISKVEEKTEKAKPQTEGINININNSNDTNIGQAASATFASGDGKKVVNKVVYCLLAFFLGGLGVHKFYSGKIGTGVLYLLFCWTYVPAFIAFVEFIIAVCQKSDSNGNILA